MGAKRRLMLSQGAAAAPYDPEMQHVPKQAPGAELRSLMAALEAELAAASAAARGPDGATVIACALEGLGLAHAPPPTGLNPTAAIAAERPLIPSPAAAPEAPAAAAAAAPPAEVAAGSGPGVGLLLGLQEGPAEAAPVEAEGHAAPPPPQEELHGMAPEGSGFEIVLQARPSLPRFSIFYTGYKARRPGICPMLQSSGCTLRLCSRPWHLST